MIRLEGVSFAYPENEKSILNEVCLTVEDGEILCIIGRSGCGKSTLLRLVAGLEIPQSGRIMMDGQAVAAPSCERSIVFQQYSLFPWLTVRGNMAFALKQTGKYDKQEIAERSKFFLEKVGLEEDMDKYPYQLSGGMRQRTAIARALAVDSPYLFLDEPFGALDTKIRRELQILLLSLWKESKRKKTILFVTHDLEEALLLGSRIILLKDGTVAKEKVISGEINDCCCRELGLETCLALKEELARWYQ